MGIKRLTVIVFSGVLMSACAASGSSSEAPGASAAAGSSTGAGNAVAVGIKEWSFTLDPSSGTSGSVTFNVANHGEFTHEFIIRKTDLAADSLPLNAAGEVNEDDPQLEDVGELEEIASGSTDKLTVTLAPGHYVIFCNLNVDTVLHYKSGLHADFTVN